jgi:hypothetical protein
MSRRKVCLLQIDKILFVTNEITRMYTFIGLNSIQFVTVFTFHVFISSVRRHHDIIETITTTSPDILLSLQIHMNNISDIH